MADDNPLSDSPNPADRAADRMQRHADRIHRKAERMRRRNFGPGGSPPVFFGIVLLVVGTLFLLDNLDMVETRSVWRNFWPLVFVGWGVSRVIAGDASAFFPWLAIGVGGLLIANRVLDWDVNVARILWPVVLIAFGAHILYRSWSRPAVVHASGAAAGPASFGATEPGASADILADSSSTFRDSAMLGSIERRNISQTFRAGEASAFMGSVEIDLRDCRMATTEAVVDVSVFMGSVELRIPRDWTVESRVSAFMGSFEDLTAAMVDGTAKLLVVRGSVLMGSVEIRN